MTKIPRPVRRALVWGAHGVLAALTLPLGLHLALIPIEFNQFWLEKQEIRCGVASWETVWDAFHSAWSSGVDILWRRPSRAAPPLEDSLAVFSHIFSWIPPHAVVYPTEGFYYFRTHFGAEEVWGNVRIADLDKGVMSLAYFTVPDQKTVMRDFTVADGLGIQKWTDGLYDVSFEGKTVRFKIPDTAGLSPRRLKMLPEEEFVGQIHDESGIRLFLIFNRATNSFYEVLNDEEGVVERFDRPEKEILAGQRTGFVFYEDELWDRKVLVGVRLDNGVANNYYDGPGDQVPFRASLREKLRIAYPSTLLESGVDEHGVWLNKPQWCRFVIAPFHSYASLDDLIARVRRSDAGAPRSEFWTQLTKEWWYTPEWVASIAEKLAQEGKSFPVKDPAVTLRYAVASAMELPRSQEAVGLE